MSGDKPAGGPVSPAELAAQLAAAGPAPAPAAASAEGADAVKQLAALLSDHYSGAIRSAIANVCNVSTALGVPLNVQQEAIDRAVLMIGLGTFMQRVTRATGKRASARDATKAMLEMCETPNRKTPAPH